MIRLCCVLRRIACSCRFWPFSTSLIDQMLRSRVTQVQDGSPASEAGVQVGDVLVSLDGRPAGELHKWKVTEALKRPGAQVEMVLKRNGNNMRIKMTFLRRLVSLY
jgi:serine protease Do